MVTTTMRKMGNNQSVPIPHEIWDDAKIAIGEMVEIFSEDGAIIIKKINKKKTIQELFEGYDGTYVPEEISCGAPVGNEVW